MLWLASLMVTFVTDFPMVSTTDIGIPTRGGAIWIDNKRSDNETQFVMFKLDAHHFFETYPNDHVYILMDGALPGGNVPYTGRGVIVSKHGEALSFHFEDFRTQTLTYAFSVPYKAEIDVMVQVNRDGLAVWSQSKYQWALMTPNNTEKVSIVIIGGTHDFSGEDRPPTFIRVRDMRMGRFVP